MDLENSTAKPQMWAASSKALIAAAMACAISCALATPVLAQTVKPNTDACAQAGNNSASQNLSDKLSRSNGVICPQQQADPGIQAPTPKAGKMPVIPPPGSPGGDQGVQPK